MTTIACDAFETPAGFDYAFYAEQNADLPADSHSYCHFASRGWRELRDPSAGFSLWWYWVMHLEGDPQAENPFEHFQRVGRTQGLTTCPPAQALSVACQADFNLRSLALLECGGFSADTLHRLAETLVRQGQLPLADVVAGRAARGEPGVARHQALWGQVLLARGIWWRAREAFDQAIALDGGTPDTWSGRGIALERLGKADEAEQAFREHWRLASGSWHTAYRLGALCKGRGALAEAAEWFTRALDCACDQAWVSGGLGALHEQFEDWLWAAEAHTEAAKGTEVRAARIRQALALARAYRWDDALSAMSAALEAGGSEAEDWYLHGLLLERADRCGEAALSYRRALSAVALDKARYRLGCSLASAGRLEEACEAWSGLTPQPLPSEGAVGEAMRRGAQLMAQSRWQEAVDVFARVLDRQEASLPEGYRQLGIALWRAGCLSEAVDAFTAMKDFPEAADCRIDGEWREDAQAQYAAFLRLPLREHCILYESYAGRAMSCSPYALFSYLLEHPAFAGWTHIWALDDHAEMPAGYRDDPRVVCVRHGGRLYRRFLATASHLVNNVTFPPYFLRRDGQRYLNTWHGTPIKTLGKDTRGFLEHRNVARNLLQASHLLSPNRHTTQVMIERHDIARSFSGQIAETGYPRVDLTLDPHARQRVRETLGLTGDRPVLLYAPTWRGVEGEVEADLTPLEADLRMLAELPVQVLFRGHQLVERQLNLAEWPMGVRCVPQSLDCNELLAAVDLLVTDYSSVLFDFLPLRRPCVLYIHDLPQYVAQRGELYLAPDSLPARCCRDRESLRLALVEALQHPDDHDVRLEEALARYCPADDGKACERVRRFFFEDDPSRIYPRPHLPAVLFHGGVLEANGITSAFRNLLDALDTVGLGQVVTLDPWRLRSYPVRLMQLAALPERVERLGRMGFPSMTPLEQRAYRLFEGHRPLGDEARALLRNVFQREFRRLFGSARFAATVNFEGFSTYWAWLLGPGAPPGCRRLMWLHSDMRAECDNRYPELATTFAAYTGYDALVSVSDSLAELNRSRLPGRRAAFVACGNALDPSSLRQRAAEPLAQPLRDWLAGRSYGVAIGRLSPEKAHEDLIEAFSRLANQQPAGCLVIAGDGPLRARLQARIASLGMADQIHLAGALGNPFPLLAGARFLAHPSRYEGQPMALLEAMVLRVPVLASDIPVHRELLGGRGLLVPSDLDSLVEGLRQAVAGELPRAAFDAEAYLRKVVHRFMTLTGLPGLVADATPLLDP